MTLRTLMRLRTTLVLVGILGCGRRTDSLAQSAAGAAQHLEPADHILIEKTRHQMTLLAHGTAVATYKIALGRGGLDPKQRQGDHKTPEGLYVVDGRKAASRFYRALHLSYPNRADRERAAGASLNPGSDIEIHGLENGLGWIGQAHRSTDWTDGCIAVTDSEMDEVWARVPIGTSVEIRH